MMTKKQSSNPETEAAFNIEQVLQQAVIHHQAGQLLEAERHYRVILATQPQHPDALHESKGSGSFNQPLILDVLAELANLTAG